MNAPVALLRAAIFVVTLVVSGCGELPSPQALADCMLDKASPQSLTEAGFLFAQRQSLPESMVGECAGWTARWRLRDEDWTVASKAFVEAAAIKSDFRAGRYQQIPPAPASARSRQRAAQLGAFLEDVAATRRDVLACGQADPDSVALVSQLDSTFALATTGLYVGVDDFEAAKTAASKIAELAMAAALTKPKGVCGAELDKTFRSHVLQWQQFYTGEHPWAPGCKVRAEDAEFVLTCP